MVAGQRIAAVEVKEVGPDSNGTCRKDAFRSNRRNVCFAWHGGHLSGTICEAVRNVKKGFRRVQSWRSEWIALQVRALCFSRRFEDSDYTAQSANTMSVFRWEGLVNDK